MIWIDMEWSTIVPIVGAQKLLFWYPGSVSPFTQKRLLSLQDSMAGAVDDFCFMAKRYHQETRKVHREQHGSHDDPRHIAVPQWQQPVRWKTWRCRKETCFILLPTLLQEPDNSNTVLIHINSFIQSIEMASLVIFWLTFLSQAQWVHQCDAVPPFFSG